MRKAIQYIFFVAAVTAVFVPTATAASVQFYEDASRFHLDGSNATVSINFSQEIDNVSIDRNLLRLGAGNLSIKNTTENNRTVVNLFTWDLAAGAGDVALNFSGNTTDRHNVTFSVGGLRADKKYVIKRDGSSYKTVSTDSNGNLSFWNREWGPSSFSVTPKTTKSDSSGDDDDGGSSGGGGGIVTGRRSTGFTATLFNVQPGVPETIEVNKPEERGITRINITVRNPVQEIRLTVRQHDQAPADVKEEVKGNLYRYTEISPGRVKESDLDNVEIAFEVNKSWIDANDINRSRVHLYRYVNDSWQQLSTEQLSETSDKIRYVADTSGFSYFAVAGDANEEEETDVQTSPVCGDEICNDSESWETCSQDCQKPQAVIDAEDAVKEAEETISESEEGYSLLQQAKNSIQEGDYTNASDLASQALEAYEKAQEEVDDERVQERERDSSTWILALVAIVALIAYGYMYTRQDGWGSSAGAAGPDYEEIVTSHTVEEVKDVVEERDDVDLDRLLEVEEANKDRVTLKRWIRSQQE